MGMAIPNPLASRFVVWIGGLRERRGILYWSCIDLCARRHRAFCGQAGDSETQEVLFFLAGAARPHTTTTTTNRQAMLLYAMYSLVVGSLPDRATLLTVCGWHRLPVQPMEVWLPVLASTPDPSPGL